MEFSIIFFFFFLNPSLRQYPFVLIYFFYLAYATLLEELIQEKQAVLEELSNKAKAFRDCLKNEEEQSNRMRH